MSADLCGACWMVSGNGEDENPLFSLAPRATRLLWGPGSHGAGAGRAQGSGSQLLQSTPSQALIKA